MKAKVVTAIGDVLRDAFNGCFTDFSNVDGVRLAFKNGWLLIRASGTEPLIRITVEGESELVAKDLMCKAIVLIKRQIEGTL